jgi:hypothetical protein
MFLYYSFISILFNNTNVLSYEEVNYKEFIIERTNPDINNTPEHDASIIMILPPLVTET